MTCCEKCAELEEEIAYLRQLLGEQEDTHLSSRLKNLFGFAPSETRLVKALYETRRFLSVDRLNEIVLRDPNADYASNNLSVRVSACRHKLGRSDAIETAHNIGYRMTDVGVRIIEQALETGIRPKPESEYVCLRQPWTDEDFRRLEAMSAMGASYRKMAAMLGRSPGAVAGALMRLRQHPDLVT